MRVLTAILIVILFTVFGNTRTKENPVNPDTHKTLLISADHSGLSNAIVMDDEWLDTQETNDLDYAVVSIIPDLYSDTQNLEICAIVPDTYEIQTIFYSPLFLDLPPPLISI